MVLEKPLPRVLLADSDRETGSRHVQILSEAGIEVDYAADAQAALQMLESQPADLVIFDMSLPHLDGLEAVRTIRALQPSAELIVISEADQDLVREVARDALVLSKPVDDETFLRASLNRIAALVTNLFARRHREFPRREAMREVAATVTKNEFGRVLDTAVRDGAVMITKHQRPHAVLMSFEEYQLLAAQGEPDLALLTRRFDAMLARMQSEQGRKAVDGLFAMSSKELGAAAAAQARRTSDGG
jgi:antitoxin Phd